MILAGDVGGTKTLLAVFDPGAGMSVVREATLPSREIDPKTARKIRKHLGLVD